MCKLGGRDHNATSYSTETKLYERDARGGTAEIITLRAIALKRIESCLISMRPVKGRDHNATSYSTETLKLSVRSQSRILQRS